MDNFPDSPDPRFLISEKLRRSVARAYHDRLARLELADQGPIAIRAYQLRRKGLTPDKAYQQAERELGAKDELKKLRKEKAEIQIEREKLMRLKTARSNVNNKIARRANFKSKGSFGAWDDDDETEK